MSFWVSEAEQKKIKKLVAKTGLSQREYLLSAALGRTIYQVEELKPTLFELKAVGRNINQLTMLAHQGRVTTVNLTEATSALERNYAAINGLYDALDGKNNRLYNENIGDYYLEKAAKAGHSVAQYRMGKMFYYGIIYREDDYEAQKWLSRSVGNGNKYADALLGKLYVESDLFGEFRNEGFDHLFKAERNGSEFAAYTLGKYYMEGKVVKKDIAKAIEHLEIASARGNMYADYRLAQIYLFEADIFDMEKALEYLNRSAHAGNESAALALTRMANNQFLAITTNVLDLVGSLASIESYRQPQDCTTMPISRKERKKHEWEQSM